MDNPRIIHAPMNGRRFAVTSPITQYDYGYLLLPEGVELPTIYEIDFSNDEKHGTSLTVYGGAEGAEVPEELIRTGKDVYAFYYRVGEGYGKTEFTWRLPNHCRPSRDGETPTPSQQSSIDQLITRSNDAVTIAEQSASEADQSAQNASADADRAEQAKDDAVTFAQRSANSAQASADYSASAQASATASANSASQSAQIKADVEDMVDDAQGYANSASQSASQASASEQGCARAVLDVASAAAIARARADEASGYAQTASAKATESAQSASQALTYKTDAESAKTASQTAQGLAESARDSAVSAKNDAEQIKTDVQNIADGIDTRLTDVEDALADTAPIITDTASGSIASFSDGADNLPLKSLVVNIDPVQDLSHGDPSPENICPISGWTQVNVNHSDADMTNPTTITISLGKTVYGGKLDVLSGVLTVDRAMVDMGTLDWSYYSSYSSFAVLVDGKVVSSSDTSYNYGLLTSVYPAVNFWWTSATKPDKSISNGAQTNVVVKDSSYTNAADFKAAMSGQQLVYKLATPIEIQLSPNQINSLLGVNNIWADSGDTEVEYRANTELWVQKKIAEAISALS